MSSSDVNAYNRSGELSFLPITLADHCVIRRSIHRAQREGNLTENDVSLAGQMSIHTCILQLRGACGERGTEWGEHLEVR